MCMRFNDAHGVEKVEKNGGPSSICVLHPYFVIILYLLKGKKAYEE